MPNDHQPMPVHGYTAQNPLALELVNTNKVMEERVLRRLDDLAQVESVDKRWLSIAKTQIEQGFMAMNRAVFKPGRTDLPEDSARAEG